MTFSQFHPSEKLTLSSPSLLQIFTTKFYVQKEMEYNFVSTQGSVNQSTLDGWEEYLDKYREFITKGTHFSNFAVQVGLPPCLLPLPLPCTEDRVRFLG